MSNETMKLDVYFTGKRVKIYKRGEVDECGGLPEGKPLHEGDRNDDEWRDWCGDHTDWRDGQAIRYCTLNGTYNAEFAADLLARAQKLMDDYRTKGGKCGWGDLEIDFSWTVHTFRSSAAWKDEPTLYTFAQTLKWTTKDDLVPRNDAELHARDCIVQLYGMSDAAHELGLDIVFDEDFKLYLKGTHNCWETSYME